MSETAAWSLAMIFTSLVSVAIAYQFDTWWGIGFWGAMTMILMTMRPQ